MFITYLRCIWDNTCSVIWCCFQFPQELSRLTANLRTLDLSENKIPRIPASISQFSMLKSIHLGHNHLSKYPVVFCVTCYHTIFNLSTLCKVCKIVFHAQVSYSIIDRPAGPCCVTPYWIYTRKRWSSINGFSSSHTRTWQFHHCLCYLLQILISSFSCRLTVSCWDV